MLAMEGWPLVKKIKKLKTRPSAQVASAPEPTQEPVLDEVSDDIGARPEGLPGPESYGDEPSGAPTGAPDGAVTRLS